MIQAAGTASSSHLSHFCPLRAGVVCHGHTQDAFTRIPCQPFRELVLAASGSSSSSGRSHSRHRFALHTPLCDCPQRDPASKEPAVAQDSGATTLEGHFILQQWTAGGRCYRPRLGLAGRPVLLGPARFDLSFSTRCPSLWFLWFLLVRVLRPLACAGLPRSC
jgi:hypothetical protein